MILNSWQLTVSSWQWPMSSKQWGVGSGRQLEARSQKPEAFFILFLFFFLTSPAQEIPVKVHGQFLTDSIKIGKPFPYTLSASYPSNQNILFPDSTYDFKPFEFSAKKYFPTNTVNGISHDSVIYYFNSFEIDSIQWLRLPVFLINDADSTAVWAKVDSVWLQQLVNIATDSIEAANLPLKINTFYEPVAWLFNYPVASIIGAIVLAVLIVLWIIFGKRIRLYFHIRSLRKTFHKYLESYSQSLDSLKENYTIAQAEKTLTIWKKYLEDLEGKPITKYTSKEILRISEHQKLNPVLNTVDRMIYGGIPPTSFDAYYELKSHAEDCFYKKIESLNKPATPLTEPATNNQQLTTA